MTIRRELHVVRTRLGGRLPKPLLHQAVPDYEETKAARARRKIVVTGVSALGAALLGRSLSTRPGSREFYTRTLSVAATWTAGGLLSGPLHLGWIQGRDEMLRRPVLTPVATGIGAFGFFYASALVSRRIPFLDDALTEVLRFADQGATPLVVLSTGANGMAEEVFFRGALYAAVGERHPVVATTAVYTLTVVPTRNPALVLAAAVMGALFGIQRRASGGIQASTITHVTWSILMLRHLPPLFRDEDTGPDRCGRTPGQCLRSSSPAMSLRPSYWWPSAGCASAECRASSESA